MTISKLARLTPTVLYDFRVAPLTYDFVTFMAVAFSTCMRNGDPKFDLLLYRPFFRNATRYENAIHKDSLCESRFFNIVIQTSLLATCVRNFSVIDDDFFIRPDLLFFPPRYDTSRVDLSSGVSQMPCNYANLELALTSEVKPWIFDVPAQVKSDKRLVTLSVRVSPQKPEIRSNLQTWYELSRWLQKEGFDVCVIPDFDDYFGNKEYARYDWSVDERSACDLRHRLTRYASAYTNIAAPAGWNVLLHFSRFPFLCPGYLLDENEVTLSMMNRKGPRPYHQPSWFTDTQRLDWTSLNLLSSDALIDIVREYLKSLD